MRALQAPARHYACVGGSVLELTGLPAEPWRPLPRFPAEGRLTWLLAAREDALAARDAPQAAYYAQLSADLAAALDTASRWDRAALRTGTPHPG